MEKVMKIFSTKQFYIALIVSVIIFSVFNLVEKYKLIGNTFTGFGTEIGLTVGTQVYTEWSGSDENMNDHDRIVGVDGKKLKSVNELQQIIGKLKPGTSVTYTMVPFSEILNQKSKPFNIEIKTMSFTGKHYLLYFVIPFIIGLTYLIISTFILFKKQKNDALPVLLIFTIMFSLSYSIIFDTDFSNNYTLVFFVSSVMAVSSLIYLGLLLNKVNFSEKTFNILKKINFLSAIIISVPLVSFYFLVKDDLLANAALYNNYIFTYQMYMYLLASDFLFFTGLLLFAYLKSPKNSLQKVQSRIIFTGSLLSFTPYIVFWLIPLVAGHKSFIPVNILTYTFFLFPLFLIYAIVRYKAFDIEFFIRKGLIYSILSGILLVAYFSISAVGAYVLPKILEIEQIGIASIAAVLSTIIVGKLSSRVQTVIDQTFYRQKVDLQRLMDKFVAEVANTQDRSVISDACFSFVEQGISPQSMALYVTGEDQALQLMSAKNENFPDTLNLDLYSLLKDVSKFLNKSIDLENELVLPLLKDKTLVGLLFLGRKNSEIEYLFEERKFLQNIAVTLSMVLQTVLLTEKSIALALQNAELENNSKFINQLTTNLSHDLKSPVGNCRMTLNKMLLKLERNGSLDNDFIKENINKLFRSFDKINEYIGLSLDRDMISAGRLILKEENVDVKQVISDSIFLHFESAERRDIKINYNLPAATIRILGDRVRFEHTISNLVSNAIKYTKDIINVDFELNDDKVVIKIQDNGKGIREELKDKIFKCYVESDNSETNVPEQRSTGFGLYICKTYIEMMGGKIWFDSKTNVGTTFCIELDLIKEFVPSGVVKYLKNENTFAGNQTVLK
jgi:signal transduction histidine kinase